jgi:hypothetical protein
LLVSELSFFGGGLDPYQGTGIILLENGKKTIKKLAKIVKINNRKEDRNKNLKNEFSCLIYAIVVDTRALNYFGGRFFGTCSCQPSLCGG